MNIILEFFNFISEQTERFPRIKGSLLWGFPVAILWPVLIPLMCGISIGDHLQYLIFHNPERKQDKLKEQITRLGRLVDEHEYLSFDIQQRIQDHIDGLYRERQDNINPQKGNGGNRDNGSNEGYSSALQSNNNIHDVTRSFLQINEIYSNLLSQSKDDSSIHRFIEDLSNAKLALYHPTPSCEKSEREGVESLSDSFQTLRALHNRVDVFPEEARDAINLEVLRFLTFAAKRLEATEDCKDKFTNEVLIATRSSYTKRAEDIRSRNKEKPTNSQFLRKFFWIEASNLLNAIEEEGRKAAAGKTTFEQPPAKTAKCILQRMKDSLPPEFLNAKLNQYKVFYREQQKQSAKGVDQGVAATAIKVIDNFLAELKEGQIGSSSSCPEKS